MNGIFSLYEPHHRQILAMGANKTSFKKGYDARRYVPVNEGLVVFHDKLGSLLRERSLDAVTFLLETMNNEKASLKLRLVAANTILDRGLGKPVDRSVIAVMDAGTNQDPTKLDTKQLEAIITKLDDKALIIDAEFKEVN